MYIHIHVYTYIYTSDPALFGEVKDTRVLSGKDFMVQIGLAPVLVVREARGNNPIKPDLTS